MDKKFHGGVRFVLLRGVGEPTIVEGVTEEELRAVLQEMGAAA
jgi:3-dehydroquinate synthetase